MLNVDLGHEHIYKSVSFIKLNLHKIIMRIYALLEKWPEWVTDIIILKD